MHEHVLLSVCTRWYDLGLELLDPKDEAKLDTIEKDSKIEGVEICCKKMFDKWLEYDNVSWNQLIQAIRKIGLKHAASEIEKLFKGKIMHMISIIISIICDCLQKTNHVCTKTEIHFLCKIIRKCTQELSIHSVSILGNVNESAFLEGILLTL